jgi:hypothetical protein
MKKRLLLTALILSLGGMNITAQEETGTTGEQISGLKGQVDGINETMLEMKTTLDALSKIKISGYIQTQYQWADTSGNSDYSVGNFAGGSFPKNVRDRFAVRRGRLKAAYTGKLTEYVLQLDVTQNGVGIKDAYIKVTEPWLKTFTLTSGIFDRPFGFEIGYSSSMRESPERSRVFQTLFPGEREIGMQLGINPEKGFLSHFNFKGGFFNGVLNTANENDRSKDFIGRLGFTAPFQEQNLSIDGGLSAYMGKVTSNSRAIYSIDKSTKTFMTDSSIADSLGKIDRKYIGADLQIYYDIPVEWLGGFSLRGEFITGDQPGTAASGVFYNPGTKQEVKTLGDVKTVDNIQPLYKRKFQGWYVTYIQNFGLKNQFVLKYDVLDPNTGVKGKDIGATTTNIGGRKLTATDVAFSTLGIGWIYHWDSNVKFVAYYDVVSNEKVNKSSTGSLNRYTKDLKDNVFTFRIQYKF